MGHKRLIRWLNQQEEEQTFKRKWLQRFCRAGAAALPPQGMATSEAFTASYSGFGRVPGAPGFHWILETSSQCPSPQVRNRVLEVINYKMTR